MGLGLNGAGGNGAGGDFRAYIKYDAKAGRLFRVDRVQQSDGWATDNVEITNTAKMVMDLANIQVGWISYTSSGPIRLLVNLGQPLPARPSEKDSKGKFLFGAAFEVTLKLDKNSGGDVRVFNSSAQCVTSAISVLHDAYEAAPEAKAGKLPIVMITDVKSVTTEKGGNKITNYNPTFSIMGWMDRPADLTADKPAEEVKAPTTAPSTGSTIVTPPKQPKLVADEYPVTPSKKLESVGADDFG